MGYDPVQKRAFRNALEMKVQRMFGRTLRNASQDQIYGAISQVVADMVKEKWAYSRELMHNAPDKELYYLSMEFLMGRALGNNLINLEIEDLVAHVCVDLGLDFEEIRELEPDAGLGNGGLGRLAACFMDSLATLGFQAHGCGIRYEYGLFKQRIMDGYQVEVPDSWLENGNNWEIALLRVPNRSLVVLWNYTKRMGCQHEQSVGCSVQIPDSSVVNFPATVTKHLDMGL